MVYMRREFIKAKATKSDWLFLAAFCALSAQASYAAEPPDCRPASKAALRTIAKGRVIAQISAVNEGDDIVVRVEVTNRGKAPYQLGAWDLPTAGQTPYVTLFEVYRDHERVRHRGLEAVPESVNDFITLCPRCTCTARIPLLERYDIDSPGLYRIQYVVNNQQSDQGRQDWVYSNVIEIEKK